MEIPVTEVRAVDIRDWGLINEDAIDIDDLEDLETLNDGVDENGVAL